MTFATRTPLGELTIEPVDPGRDAALLQEWLAHPASAFWQMDDLSVAEVRDYFAGIATDPHQDAWLGRLDGDPVLLAETYDPRRVLLPGHFDAVPGDLGMHVLVAPRAPGTEPRHGLTDAAFGAVMRFCLSDAPGARGALRVVVEPDARNAPIAAKNAAAGFRVLREITLPGKRAMLSLCDRADFAASPLGAVGADPSPLASHLRPELGRPGPPASRREGDRGVRPERLFLPERADGTETDTAATHHDAREYLLAAGEATYRFWARRHLLEHWIVDEASITRTVAGDVARVDALEIITDLQPVARHPREPPPAVSRGAVVDVRRGLREARARGCGHHAGATRLAELLTEGDPDEAFQAVEPRCPRGIRDSSPTTAGSGSR